MNRPVLAGFSANELIPKLACCQGEDSLANRDRSLIDPDFNAVMDFFCNRWRGKSGNLEGCQLRILPANSEAVIILNACGLTSTQRDIESAMRLAGIADVRDCWGRYMLLKSEMSRKK